MKNTLKNTTMNQLNSHRYSGVPRILSKPLLVMRQPQVFNGDTKVNPSLIPQIYRCYIVWNKRIAFILFPGTVYIASLGEHCPLLAFSSLINPLQLPVLVFLSQWVKPTMARWCSVNYSVTGFQAFSRPLLQPVPFAPVSHCRSSN